MISTIISVVVFAYCAYLALIWASMFISLIIGSFSAIFSGKWKGFLELLGLFLYFNGSLGFGFTIGVFIFGNLLNWMTEGQFAIQIINPNKLGIIFLVVSVTFYIIGKILMREKEEKDEKLINIPENEEIKIKDLVGGWLYWNRMNNKTKNQYIKEYRKTGTIVLSK